MLTGEVASVILRANLGYESTQIELGNTTVMTLSPETLPSANFRRSAPSSAPMSLTGGTIDLRAPIVSHSGCTGPGAPSS